MCVDLFFHHILAVTFFKTCLFTSLALGDCHTLQDNCCCICENVLVRVYRFDSGDLFFFHSGLFLLDLSSVVNTAFQITGQICSEYLKVAKNVTPGFCGMGLRAAWSSGGCPCLWQRIGEHPLSLHDCFLQASQMKSILLVLANTKKTYRIRL